MEKLIKDWLQARQKADAIESEKKAAISPYEERMKEAQEEEAICRNLIQEELQETGECKVAIDAINYTVYMQDNPPKVLCDKDSVPDEFCRIKREPDMAKIKKYLKENECNWARTESTGRSLRIKVS